MLKKDYLITTEQVQNWQPLHDVLNELVGAIKELQERVGAPANDENPKPKKPKSEKKNAADVSEPNPPDADS
jgi:hypothetical protein